MAYGLGSLGGVPFRVDPTAINWNYTPKISTTETVYGKVVQVYGSALSDLTVTGFFGTQGALDQNVRFNESWESQQAFLNQVEAWSDQAVGYWAGNAGTRTATGQGINNGAPIRFTYPPLGFDFLVYIKAFSQPASAYSIKLDPTVFSPHWQLTLFIYQDNAKIKTVNDGNMVDYIKRISGTFGWYPNEYNGPVSTAPFYPTLK
jgi:hypothetical protein